MTAPLGGYVRTRPEFLPLEFSWEGTFEYELESLGHHWQYARPDTWRRLENTECVAFAENAIAVSAQIDFLDGVIRQADLRPPDWLLVRWLAAPDAPVEKKVGPGVTLVLNAIVKDATLHQFEILSSFCGDNVTVEIRGLCQRAPSWFFLRGPGASALDALPEFLLAAPEAFTQDGKSNLQNLKPDTRFVEVLKRLRFIRVLHNYSIQRFEKTATHVQVTLRDHATVEDYVRARLCRSIALPGKGPKERKKEPAGVNAPEVVVSSPAVGDALEELSRIWQDPFAKSVLISAPPGSGKEVFAASIPYGNGRPTENFESLSMASGEQGSVELQLYGSERADGSIQPGLIAKAAKSALFLDEVHQPEGAPSPARISLLRPLESDEYFPVKSNKRQEVDDVLFIMATSKSLQHLGECKPPDFWTRMTHAAQIQHPLDFIPTDAMPAVTDVTAKFFSHFWWDRTEKHYRLAPIFTPPRGSGSEEPATLLIQWQVHSISKLIDETSDYPGTFAAAFSRELIIRRMSPSEFSVRGIRNMVTRLFSIAASTIAQGREPWNGEHAHFKTDVKAVFAEILKVAKLNK